MFKEPRLLRASGERGQTLILVALILFVLLAAGALAVDVGGILWSRGTEQDAADAAALAGVKELPGDPTQAQAAALAYATKNGFSTIPGEVSVDVSYHTTFNDNDTLTATIWRRVPAGLRAAVGAGDTWVPAQASAIVTTSMPPCTIFPWGIDENADFLGADGHFYRLENAAGVLGLPYGVPILLKQIPNGRTGSTRDARGGDFLELSLQGADVSGGGTSAYRWYIQNGGCVSRTDQVETLTGNRGANTETAVTAAIKATDPCWVRGSNEVDSVNWTAHPPTPYMWSYPCASPPKAPIPLVIPNDNTRIGIIPILDKDDFNEALLGGHWNTVKGWAYFYLITLADGGPGETDYVVGAFLEPTEVKAGVPAYGMPLTGPLGYFLWR